MWSMLTLLSPIRLTQNASAKVSEYFIFWVFLGLDTFDHYIKIDVM